MPDLAQAVIITLLLLLAVQTATLGMLIGILARESRTKRRLAQGLSPEPIPLPKSKRPTDELLGSIIEEARLLAEQAATHNRANGHKMNGAEKQRVAMDHVKSRAEALKLSVDFPLVVARLENSVRKDKEQSK